MATPQKQIVLTIRENDPVLAFIEANRLPGERANSTTVVRILRELIKAQTT